MSNGEEITEFAESLRRLKDRSGQSYGALAARLHVSTSTLHRYCNGDAVPAEYAPVERFARQCGATPEELIALHRRWILADAARRSASGRGDTGRATTPDGASGHATARHGSAARAAGAPDPADRTSSPPAPATPTVGAAEAAGRTADTRDEPRGAKRPRTAGNPADSLPSPTKSQDPSSPAQPDHRPPAPSAAQARGSADPDIGQPRAPFTPAASPAVAPHDGDRPNADEGGPGPAESDAGRTAGDTAKEGGASEAGRGGASRAGGVGTGPGARGDDGPSVERQRARAGGGRRAAGGTVARGGRASDGPGGRAAGAVGRGRGVAGRGALRPVPTVDGAGRRPVGLRGWRSRPWGLVLGAAAAAVLALTAVEVRSTTGGEQEDAAKSPSSPSSPAPSATASSTAPPARPTARGRLKKDDTGDGHESASPRGGERRGDASASASPKKGGSSGGGSGGGGDDKPGSGTPLTISTRSHVWENGCGHRYLIDRPPSQVAPPPVEQDAAAWASAHGAVHGGTTIVETTVKGRSESAVVLQALHVRVVGRRAPLSWSSFAMDNGCGGSLTPRAFSVNLDAARPLAVPTDGNDAGEPIPAVRFPYRVSDTDPEVLLVNARTSGCDCSWYLELDWTSGDREGTIRIDDHGAPFRTSSVRGRPEYGYQFEEQVWRRND